MPDTPVARRDILPIVLQVPESAMALGSVPPKQHYAQRIASHQSGLDVARQRREVRRARDLFLKLLEPVSLPLSAKKPPRSVQSDKKDKKNI